MKEDLMDRARRYAKTHIDACENWPHGGISDVWEEGDGRLCIQYEDGSWWHYKEHDEELEWY